MVVSEVKELLLKHDCVILPGFGAFIARQAPAGIHPVTHRFIPPSVEIVFNPAIRHDDGLFTTLLAAKNNCSFGEAREKVSLMTNALNALLLASQSVEFNGVGTLRMENNMLRFDPLPFEHPDNYGLTGFVSPAILREGIERRIEKTLSGQKIIRSERQSRGFVRKGLFIGVPAAAVVVWGVLNIAPIRDISTGYSGFFNGLTGNLPKVKSPEQSIIIKSHGPELKNQWYQFSARDPRHVVYPVFTGTQTDNNEVVTDDAVQESVPATVQTENSCRYFIIGSCNRDKQLAENYVKRLKQKGFASAGILDQGAQSLYKVYISCSSDEESAKNELARIQGTENPDAWLLKK